MPGDARTSNWRFVVPDEPPGMVVLPSPGRADTRAALQTGPFPALAVPDVGACAPAHGRPTGRLVADLCRSVAPGGWLCLGFANALAPGAPRHGALRLSAVRRALRRSGLERVDVYLGLPGHHAPAMLVPAARRTELDVVLTRLFLTYVPPGASAPRLRRRLLAAARAVAAVTPHRLRTAFAPGYLVVARRPA